MEVFLGSAKRKPTCLVQPGWGRTQPSPLLCGWQPWTRHQARLLSHGSDVRSCLCVLKASMWCLKCLGGELRE